MTRWAWRLFRREWRQQLLVLALITVAVAATVIGAAVATNTPRPANAGFGTADDAATFGAPDLRLAAQIAALQHRFGPLDVIENQTVSVPGSVDTFQLRAQDPHGPYGRPMLSLVSGRFPAGPGEVALTAGVASELGLSVGDAWHEGGSSRRIVGIVENPQSLLDEFALVVPGQVTTPTQVTVLFDAWGIDPGSIGPTVATPATQTPGNVFNPETIVLGLTTLGMLLICLVGIGGFTVVAQRRLRSIGMLEALGATDKNVRQVVRANGVVVGVVGSLIGLVIGLLAWLAYRPELEQHVHHVIGVWQLPWVIIGSALVLAVLATYVAASRPARTITKVPIVTALSGRPAPPKPDHRTAVPGLVVLGIAFGLFSWAGSNHGGGGGLLQVVLGFVTLIAAVLLLAPVALTTMARLARRAPIAIRMALGDLARYRARSGSALGAISLGVLIAVVISVVAAGRYSEPLDYVGPNLASNQLIVYPPAGPGGGPGQVVLNGSPPPVTATTDAQARGIAAAVGSHDVLTLETTSATLQHDATGRNYSGPLYLATPALLRAFGINPSTVDRSADILTMRPGLASTSKMQLVYGNYFDDQVKGPPRPPGPGTGDPFPCPRGECLANPTMQQVSALPRGTSAPNTVITEHAVRTLGLQPSVSTAGWLIVTMHPLTPAQTSNARLQAAAVGMTIETKSESPTSAEIINWATAFGILLALAILAMTVGLIRSETARDLRTLTATGASSSTRRALTASTAGGLALAGAVLGTIAGYVAAIGFYQSNQLEGGVSSLVHATPARNLLVILVGMPLIAVVGGWLFSGREPRSLSLQPME